MRPNSALPEGLPPQSFDHDTAYHNVIDVKFVSRVLASGACCVRGARWPTQTLYPSDAPGILATAYYHYNRSFEALASVDNALAHLVRQGDTVTVRLAADDEETLNRAEARLREQLPEPHVDSHEVAVEFSYWVGGGAAVTTRTLTVPTLAEIKANYPASVRRALEEVCTQFRPGARGRMLLWHGAPGCGKTWALRALASEWRSWCCVRCVTDPERLLSEPAYLVDLIHARPGVRDDGQDWRLIVLETPASCLPRMRRSRQDRGSPGC